MLSPQVFASTLSKSAAQHTAALRRASLLPRRHFPKCRREGFVVDSSIRLFTHAAFPKSVVASAFTMLHVSGTCLGMYMWRAGGAEPAQRQKRQHRASYRGTPLATCCPTVCPSALHRDCLKTSDSRSRLFKGQEACVLELCRRSESVLFPKFRTRKATARRQDPRRKAT